MQDSPSILGLAWEFCLIQPAISYSLVLFFTSTKANFLFFFLSLHAFNQMYAKPHGGFERWLKIYQPQQQRFVLNFSH